MSERERENLNHTADDNPSEATGTYSQVKGEVADECKTEPEDRTNRSATDNAAEPLAGDSTRFGKP